MASRDQSSSFRAGIYPGCVLSPRTEHPQQKPELLTPGFLPKPCPGRVPSVSPGVSPSQLARPAAPGFLPADTVLTYEVKPLLTQLLAIGGTSRSYGRKQAMFPPWAPSSPVLVVCRAAPRTRAMHRELGGLVALTWHFVALWGRWHLGSRCPRAQSHLGALAAPDGGTGAVSEQFNPLKCSSGATCRGFLKLQMLQDNLARKHLMGRVWEGKGSKVKK